MNEIVNNFSATNSIPDTAIKTMRRIHDRQPKIILHDKKVHDLYSGRRYQDYRRPGM